MRRLSLSVAVLALSLVGVGLVSQHSAAAPLPAAYSAAAGGDLAALDLDDFTTGPNLSNGKAGGHRRHDERRDQPELDGDGQQSGRRAYGPGHRRAVQHPDRAA